jgi:hypothetical protein
MALAAESLARSVALDRKTESLNRIAPLARKTESLDRTKGGVNAPGTLAAPPAGTAIPVAGNVPPDTAGGWRARGRS